MDFDEALERFGFRLRDERGYAREAQLYVAMPNGYMTYMVHAYPDGTANFSWEFALGEFLLTRGIQVGSDETLNQFAYPREDVRGPQEAAWLAAAIEQAEALLADVRLDRPDG
jgi:hypothetical protein